MQIIIPHLNSGTENVNISFNFVSKLIQQNLLKKNLIIDPAEIKNRRFMFLKNNSDINSDLRVIEINLIKTTLVYQKLIDETNIRNQIYKNLLDLKSNLKKISLEKDGLINKLSKYTNIPELDFMIVMNQESFHNAILDMKKSTKNYELNSSKKFKKFENHFLVFIPQNKIEKASKCNL